MLSVCVCVQTSSLPHTPTAPPPLTPNHPRSVVRLFPGKPVCVRQQHPPPPDYRLPHLTRRASTLCTICRQTLYKALLKLCLISIVVVGFKVQPPPRLFYTPQTFIHGQRKRKAVAHHHYQSDGVRSRLGPPPPTRGLSFSTHLDHLF